MKIRSMSLVIRETQVKTTMNNTSDFLGRGLKMQGKQVLARRQRNMHVPSRSGKWHCSGKSATLPLSRHVVKELKTENQKTLFLAALRTTAKR